MYFASVKSQQYHLMNRNNKKIEKIKGYHSNLNMQQNRKFKQNNAHVYIPI